jgi:hypothetical protein
MLSSKYLNELEAGLKNIHISLFYFLLNTTLLELSIPLQFKMLSQILQVVIGKYSIYHKFTYSAQCML